MSKDPEKIKQLLKKIQNLAERGVGGEQETAHKKLEQILAENNMTEDDLKEDTTEYYLFSYAGAPYREKLLAQVIYKVLGASSSYTTYHSKGTRNKIGIYCTPAQKIEIDLDYEFYRNLFEQEVKILMSAFINKQDLYPEDAPTQTIHREELTPEERAKLRKMAVLEASINKRHRPEGYIEEKEDS